MPPTLVQQQIDSATGSGGGSTLTFGANFTNGNMLVIGLEENDDATGPSIAATGVTFTKQWRFRGDGTHDNFTLWTGVVGASAGNVVTITPNAALNNFATLGSEWSGVQQVVDGTPPTATNVTSATPSVTSNTPTVAGDLAVAFCGHTDAIGPTATPSSWTTLTRSAATNSIEGAYFVNSGSSAVTPQWTFAASKAALLAVALIKATVAAGNTYTKTGAGVVGP